MTDTLDAIAREMEAACPGYAGPDAEYSVDASKVWAWAQALRKITALSNQGEGAVVSGVIAGYLPMERAIEVKLDADLPAWVRDGVQRVYLTTHQILDAIGRSGEGHNADWCAGWNSHLLQTAKAVDAEADRRDAERMREAIELTIRGIESGNIKSPLVMRKVDGDYVTESLHTVLVAAIAATQEQT